MIDLAIGILRQVTESAVTPGKRLIANYEIIWLVAASRMTKNPVAVVYSGNIKGVTMIQVYSYK